MHSRSKSEPSPTGRNGLLRPAAFYRGTPENYLFGLLLDLGQRARPLRQRPRESERGPPNKNEAWGAPCEVRTPDSLYSATKEPAISGALDSRSVNVLLLGGISRRENAGLAHAAGTVDLQDTWAGLTPASLRLRELMPCRACTLPSTTETHQKHARERAAIGGFGNGWAQERRRHHGHREEGNGATGKSAPRQKSINAARRAGGCRVESGYHGPKHPCSAHRGVPASAPCRTGR
jgi:hypothetical protein